MTQVRTRTHIDQSIKADNAFSGSFHHLLDGFREVKLSRSRSDDLFSTISRGARNRAIVNKNRCGAETDPRMNVTKLRLLIGRVQRLRLPYTWTARRPPPNHHIILFCTGGVELMLAVCRRSPVRTPRSIAAKTRRDIEAARAHDELAGGDLRPTFKQIKAARCDYAYDFRQADGPLGSVRVSLSIRAGEIGSSSAATGAANRPAHLLTRLYEPITAVVLWDGAP